MAFWEYLNTEVQNAAVEGAGFILQMDGNLWAGENIMKGDLNIQNQNGKIFEQFFSNKSEFKCHQCPAHL